MSTYSCKLKCPIPSKPVITNSGLNNTHFTQNQRHAYMITNTRYNKGGRFRHLGTKVNQYGKWTGSPSGYGQSPKNSF